MFVRKIFIGMRKSDVSNRIRTFNLIGDKRDKYLEGEITIGRCRGHETIIIFFHFKRFYEQHVRLLSKNIYFH